MRLFQIPIVLSILFATRTSGHSQARSTIDHVSVLENPAIHTIDGKVDHFSRFEISFGLEDGEQRLRLNMEPNHDILGDDSHIQYLAADGTVRRSQLIDRSLHKVFRGTAWRQVSEGNWEEVGWARIYVKRDGPSPLMEGAFSVDGAHHHIQLHSSYMQMRREYDVRLNTREENYMIVYRDFNPATRDQFDLKREAPASSTCGVDELNFDMDSFSWLDRRQTRTSDLRSTIGSRSGCPSSKRVALIGIATDCSYTASFSSSEEVNENIISIVNTASNVYERTFNITIGLRNLTVSDAECPTSVSQSTRWNVPCSTGTIEDRLNWFSEWRGQRSDTNAYWTLLSTCNTVNSVGLAWLGQLCVSGLTGYGSQSVNGANVVVRTPGEWQVFAHETAHTFGAVHDCTSTSGCQSSTSDRCCPLSTSICSANGEYLMHPASSRSLTDFSPCTIGNICSALGRNSVSSSCLSANRNLTTINGSQCGNGIVEAGEDCDCGGEGGCGENSCCNPTTCRFNDGAVCDDSNDACCSSCQFASSDTVCRASIGICDLEERCTGSSSSCPTDEYRPNGQTCGNNTELACASGQCTSRDLQCQGLVDRWADSNYTRACSSNSCELRCSSDGASYCASLGQNFLDGTPCNDDGRCNSGRCSNSNDDNSSSSGGSSWIDRNRPLFIGLVAGIGGLVVIILGCCVLSCCRRRRKRQNMPPPTSAPPMGYYSSSNVAYPAYPPRAHPNLPPGQGRLPLVRYA